MRQDNEILYDRTWSCFGSYLLETRYRELQWGCVVHCHMQTCIWEGGRKKFEDLFSWWWSCRHKPKPMTGNTLLHASSSHPTPLIHSLLYAQYLCVHRNCTTEKDVKTQAAMLRHHLLARGYCKGCLRNSKTLNPPCFMNLLPSI